MRLFCLWTKQLENNRKIIVEERNIVGKKEYIYSVSSPVDQLEKFCRNLVEIFFFFWKFSGNKVTR